MAEVLDRKTIKALSADSRQEIMKMLAKRPYTASEIAKATGKHVTTVTEHLDTLESSGLIKKKDSTNKWVYYELTQKGEHLFKPQYYSWIIVFSISAVLMFTGFLRLVQPFDYVTSADSGAAPLMANIAEKTVAQTVPVASADFLGYALIGLGLIGFTYLAYRKYFPGVKE